MLLGHALPPSADQGTFSGIFLRCGTLLIFIAVYIVIIFVPHIHLPTFSVRYEIETSLRTGILFELSEYYPMLSHE